MSQWFGDRAIFRVYSSASRNFWPGQNFWPHAKISAWNSGLEKMSRNFRPEIPGQNFKPKFQAEIPGQKMCLILFSCLLNANLGIKVLRYCSCDFSLEFDLRTWKIQTSHDILAWNFLASNFVLKFWPGISA